MKKLEQKTATQSALKKLISLFVSDLLQLKNALKIRLTDLVGLFSIYVCTYYFVPNKIIKCHCYYVSS